VLDTKPEGDTPPAEGWGEDWRQKYAGEDDKALKRLERYASPKALIDALFEAQKKISAGDFAKPLAADATPEQAAEWRKANGLPEKAAGYFDKLPDGLVIGDDDKAIFESFAEKMHAKNVAPEVMHEVVRWYNEYAEAQVEGLAEKEASSRATAEEALRDEWGADYRANVNMVNGLLSAAPEGVKDALHTARLPDGTPLGNHPAVLRWLAQTARELNPAATLIPGSGEGNANSLDAEITNIEKQMRENRTGYMRDEKTQARYRQLLEAREKLARKAG
jgi:hypothetical protein